MHRLFISPSCPHCSDILNVISQNNLGTQIQSVNIHACQQHELRGLHSVPTIVAHGKQFVGTAAFEFINEMMTIDPYDGTDSLSDINSIGDVSFGPDWKPGQDNAQEMKTDSKNDIDALIQRRNQELV